MDYPQHPNPGNAKVCTQSVTPLANPSATEPRAFPTASPQAPVASLATPSGSHRTVPIVLGVIFTLLLLFVAGLYAAFHMAANKLRALAGVDAQASMQSQDKATDSAAQAGASQTGNVIGNLLGTDAKGKADIGNALDNMTRAGAQIEQHDKANGNTGLAPDAADTEQAMAAAGGLLGALAGSLGGAHRHDPVDFHTLESMLPTSLPGMQRGAPRGEANQAMHIKSSSAQVDFSGADNSRVNLSIKDATALSGLAGLASMADSTESEQGDSYEKNETIRGYTVHETWDASSKHGALSLIVAKRYGVDVSGDRVGMDALKNALGQVDLGKLEAMKDANPQAK
ncbi:MAG: hypothetical protein ABI389_13970 [Rhodanobacter sp.]